MDILNIDLEHWRDQMENIITQLKQNNRLLNIIRCNPGISKNVLAEQFDVSWPTMSNTIEMCRKAEILSEDASIQLNPHYAHMIGISVGAAQIKLCIIDMNFEMIDSYTFERIIDRLGIFGSAVGFMKEKQISVENFVCFKTASDLYDLQCQMDSIMRDLICLIEYQDLFGLNIISIGLTFTGAIDNINKKIIKSHNLEFISDKPLSNIIFPHRIAYFESKNINIYMDNNSNSSVVAEKYNLFHPMNSNYKYRQKNNIMAIYLGAGIGAGMIFNNKLYRGASNFIGELGHIDVSKYPNIVYNDKEMSKVSSCSCGSKNCLDLRIRTDVFEMTMEEFARMNSDEVDFYFDLHPEKLEIMAYYIGNMINLLINILNLDMIIFTGKFRSLLNRMWLPLYKQINTNKLSYISNECTLIASNLGVTAPAIGVAICSYFDKIQEEIEW